MAFKYGISAINWSNEDIIAFGDRYTADDILGQMSELGFKGTENSRKFPATPSELKGLMAHYEMELTSQWNSVHFSEPARVEEELRAFYKLVDYLHETGCKHVVTCDCGNTFEDLEANKVEVAPLTEEQWKSLAAGLNQAGAYCSSKGMKLVYHFHGETVIETGEQIDRLMASTNPEYVHMLFDTGHAYYGGSDPLQLLQKHISRVAYVHLKDIRKEELQKLRNSGLRFRTGVRDGVFTVPGDGCIAFQPILQLLKDSGYDGWIIIEAEQDPEKANPKQYAQKAISYLRSIHMME